MNAELFIMDRNSKGGIFIAEDEFGTHRTKRERTKKMMMTMMMIMYLVLSDTHNIIL